MGASSSNLTAAGLDMVCAITEQALNDTLILYLAGLKMPELSACYLVQGDAFTFMPVAEVAAAIGCDPFSLGPESDPGPLERIGFVFGFKAKPGPPPGMSLRTMPRPILLDQGSHRVTHQLSFSELRIVWLSGDDSKASKDSNTARVNLFVQDASNVATITSVVGLSVGDAAPDELPDEVRAGLAAAGSNDPFSVKKLFLDLAGAYAGDCPALGAAAGPFPTADCLTATYIIEQYWKNMPARAGHLGYGATAPAGASPTLTPAKIGFVVSPHLGPDGQPSGNHKLNTLNWLVMTGDAPLPAPAPFSWNWVEDGEDPPDGIIAVRRGVFLRSMGAALDPVIAPLCYNIFRDVVGSPALGASDSPGHWEVLDAPSIQLHFDFSSVLRPERTFIEDLLGLTYQFSGDVSRQSWRGPSAFDLTTYVVMQTYPWGGEDQINDFVYFVVSSLFSLEVSGDGRLIAKAGDQTTQDSSTPIPDNYPYSASLKAMLESQRTAIPNALMALPDSMTSMLGTTHNWVLPVGRSLIPKAPIMSDALDLVVEVTCA